MPIKVTRSDVLAGYTTEQRDRIYPEWANDADPQLGIAPADEQCHSRVEIHYDTDFMVVATDGKEISELIDAAAGMLGTVATPSPMTVINGARIGSTAISNVLGKANHSDKQEFKLNPIPCIEKGAREGQRFKVSFEVVGDWLVNDPDARFDKEEVARLSLYVRAAGNDDSAGFEHAKRTATRVPFPIPRKDGSAVHFKVEVVTPPVTQPFKVYARATQEVQTNGPGNSAWNPLDLIEDAFTNSVSAIRIDSFFIVIEDAPAEEGREGD